MPEMKTVSIPPELMRQLQPLANARGMTFEEFVRKILAAAPGNLRDGVLTISSDKGK